MLEISSKLRRVDIANIARDLFHPRAVFAVGKRLDIGHHDSLHRKPHR